MKTDFLVEEVAPVNERGEDPVVALFIVVVLSVAALLLWLRQPLQVERVERFPDGVRHVLTELSVAATELKMMAELDDSLPSIQELRDFGVPPFASDNEGIWNEVIPGCYLGSRGLFDLRLKVNGSLTTISWRKVSAQPAINQRSNLESALCNIDLEGNNLGGWSIYEPLQSVNKQTHSKHPH